MKKENKQLLKEFAEFAAMSKHRNGIITSSFLKTSSIYRLAIGMEGNPKRLTLTKFTLKGHNKEIEGVDLNRMLEEIDKQGSRK